MKNIEIKAVINDIEKVKAKAAEICDTPMVTIHQHDTFFHLTEKKAALGGRLKLRKFKNGNGELIYYERPNVKGPKISNYSKVTLDAKQLKEMNNVLTESNGILGVVEKFRHLYIIRQTRIHIDIVKDLGNFIEFEVVLNDETEKHIEDAKGTAKLLLNQFEITNDSLLPESYLDIILKK